MEMGNIFSKKNDFIYSKLKKLKTKLHLESLLKINENPFLIKLLNYEKNDAETIIENSMVIKKKRIEYL